MRELFEKLKETLEQKKDAVLVTIVSSTGSTPRGKGARMVVTMQGLISGTIGGGAIEHHGIHRAKEILSTKETCVEHFTLRPNEVQDLGMVCGGEVDLHFQYLSSEIADNLQQMETIVGLFLEKKEFWLAQELSSSGLFEIEMQQPKERDSSKWYCEKMIQPGRVYIFGGGHVSQALVPILASVEFRCVVLEDREEFTKPELFPCAEEIILIDNHRLSDYVQLGKEDYACVMTRGHKDDFLVQAQVLETSAHYIGVIGSAHKKASVFERLREQGVTDKALERITTPIGLSIAAQTPAEIAISIAAQLIAVRAETIKAKI